MFNRFFESRWPMVIVMAHGVILAVRGDWALALLMGGLALTMIPTRRAAQKTSIYIGKDLSRRLRKTVNVLPQATGFHSPNGEFGYTVISDRLMGIRRLTIGRVHRNAVSEAYSDLNLGYKASTIEIEVFAFYMNRATRHTSFMPVRKGDDASATLVEESPVGRWQMWKDAWFASKMQSFSVSKQEVEALVAELRVAVPVQGEGAQEQ